MIWWEYLEPRLGQIGMRIRMCLHWVSFEKFECNYVIDMKQKNCCTLFLWCEAEGKEKEENIFKAFMRNFLKLVIR